MNKFLKIFVFFVLPVILSIGSFFWGYADVFFSPGKLSLGHKKWNNNCLECHSPFQTINNNCLDCHKIIKNRLKKKSSFHSVIDSKILLNSNSKSINCVSCHTDHKGEKKFIITDIRNLKQLESDLRNTTHKQKINKNLIKTGIKKLKSYQSIWKRIKTIYKNNDYLKHKLKIKEQIDKVLENNFPHELTSNILLGPHKKVKCSDCHENNFQKENKELSNKYLWPKFYIKKDKSFLSITQCYSCHKKDDDEKGHKGKYGKNCLDCHLQLEKSTWKSLKKKIRYHHSLKANKNIFSKIKHELSGKHAIISCRKCHIQTPFKQSTQLEKCTSCHEEEDNKSHKKSLTKNRQCSFCHYTDSFTPSFFNHDKSNFVLKFSHKKLTCMSCHENWNDKKGELKIYEARKKYDCVDCHQKNDIHLGSFGTNCKKCHKESKWGNTKKLW